MLRLCIRRRINLLVYNVVLYALCAMSKNITWILHESEAFIGKASEGDDVVAYFESSVTQHMEASGSPEG